MEHIRILGNPKNGEIPKRWTRTNCLSCQVEIHGPPSVIRNRRYCSVTCKMIEQNRRHLLRDLESGWEPSSKVLSTRRYRADNNEKTRAHKAVERALRKGEMKPGTKCQSRKRSVECSETERLEAHHDDYSKPLRVRWLCPAHHRAWHRDRSEA